MEANARELAAACSGPVVGRASPMRPLSGEVATVGVAPGQGELHVTGQSMERRERRGQHARQRETA